MRAGPAQAERWVVRIAEAADILSSRFSIDTDHLDSLEHAELD